ETGEEGREQAILEHLLRTAVAETVRTSFRGLDFAELINAIEESAAVVTTGEQVSAGEVLEALPPLGESTFYDDVYERFGATSDGQRASAIELALEGLFLARKISKDESPTGETTYGS